MVFSSVPVYLDPPNWQQQANHQNHQTQGGGGIESFQLPLPPPPLPMRGGGGDGDGETAGAIRRNSMAERARMAKVPQPEAALKCPRCESTNTKFCYFNNYSLLQPRHFCKTCRRYWTRGGALRSVPVGGGCRRNKRRKGSSSRSKSSAVITAQQQGQAPARVSSSSALSYQQPCTTDHIIIDHHLHNNPLQHVPLFPTLNHLDDHYSFGAIQSQGGAISNGNIDIGFQAANNGTSNSESIFPSGLIEQWKLQQTQQFAFLGTGLEQATGLYSFDQSDIGQLPSNKPAALDAGATQLANVKMEENDQRLNLSRNFLGICSENDQLYNWGTNNSSWTDLSGLTSSSTTHLF